MFGIPIDGATNVYCNNEAVFKNVVNPDSTLNKKQHSMRHYYCRQIVVAGVVRVAKEDSSTKKVYVFTKCMNKPKLEALLGNLMYSQFCHVVFL